MSIKEVIKNLKDIKNSLRECGDIDTLQILAGELDYNIDELNSVPYRLDFIKSDIDTLIYMEDN